MNVLDLFSGIGGFSLGLERAGFSTKAFCECDPYCQAVLRKHWPDVPIFDDVRTLTKEKLVEHGVGAIDLICGGFPCQDISIAGRGEGIDGPRSGLWREQIRIVGEVRPRFVLIENSSRLLTGGGGEWFAKLLSALAFIGYDARWYCLSASSVGAEHKRKRLWILAYPYGEGKLQLQGSECHELRRDWYCSSKNDADIDQARHSGRMQAIANGWNVENFEERLRSAVNTENHVSMEHWDHQPILGRGVHGIPNRVDRVGALGNAVYPKIPELFGRAIKESLLT